MNVDVISSLGFSHRSAVVISTVAGLLAVGERVGNDRTSAAPQLVGPLVLTPRLIRPPNNGGGRSPQFGAREPGSHGIGPAAQPAESLVGGAAGSPCRPGRQRWSRRAR